MKNTKKKAYVKPCLVNQVKRGASAYVCCGMGTSATCSINRSRIS